TDYHTLSRENVDSMLVKYGCIPDTIQITPKGFNLDTVYYYGDLMRGPSITWWLDVNGNRWRLVEK
ncbi:MAG: hypothetical protein Q4D14_03115, partial [Bacteroidales bacterium]|nr:hypothetical protein [Bacteroidales bacterium]